ncbi:MAG TPA: ABC transporter substrate-binding protein [Methanospirillum sp.]|nr:ABC transporter substrate-binding protein [Methanospirillum sp.]
MKRTADIVIGCCIFLLIITIIPFPASAVPDNNSFEPVLLQLKWTHQFQFAGYYVASEKGYYRDSGLNVTILEGSSTINPVDRVISDIADIGVGTSEIALQRAKGNPLVVLGTIFQHSPLIFLVKENSGISNIHDLVGKRVMMEAGSEELIAYLIHEGISPDNIEIISDVSNLTALLTGEVDAISAYSTTEPYLLSQKGVRFLEFTPRASGIDFYGDNLFTSESYLKKHPDTVKKFIDASRRGWEYALKHPNETADLITLRYKPDVSNDQLLFEADQMQRLIMPDIVQIGYMNPGRWQNIIDIYDELGMIHQSFPLDSFLYNPNPRPDTLGFFIVMTLFGGIAVFCGYAFFHYHRLSNSLKKEIESRIKIEKELQETSEIFRLFSDNSSEVLYITDLNTTKALYMSPSIEKLSGYTVEEAIRLRPDISMTPESYASIAPKLVQRARLFSEGTGDKYEYVDELEHYRKDGSSVLTEVTSTYIRSKDGEPLRICVLRDITERKKIEEALKESESFNRGLVENLPDYIVVYGNDKKILYVNPAGTTELGYQHEEIVSMPAISFFAEEFKHTGEEILSSLIEGTKVSVYETDIVCRDQSRRTVIIKGTHIQYHNCPAILLLMSDITHRKQMEQVLKENEEKFISIFEGTPDPILILNSIYQIVEVNLGFLTYFEWSYPDVAGKLLDELGIRLTKQNIEDILSESEDDTPTPHIERELLKRTGAVFIAEVAISRIFVNSEPCIIIQIHDIDEIRKAHEAISQVNNKLKILSSVTRHDILNRIMVTSAYSGMIHEEVTDPDLQRKIRAIQQSSDEIQNLIEFTGQYQNLGEAAPTWQIFDRFFKIRAVQGLLSGINLILDLKGTEIYADNMLEKVIYNLVENSVRHGKNLTLIRLSCLEESGVLVIRYEDDGGGIISEEKEKVFEKGFGKNTGLGLFLIREILSITGISIVENGRPGEGVRFEILVPAGKWRMQRIT